MRSKNLQVDGKTVANALYGTNTVYQVRDISGRKVLERESVEEIRHYLRKRPTSNYEIWQLSGMPGELKDIKSGDEFLNGRTSDTLDDLRSGKEKAMIFDIVKPEPNDEGWTPFRSGICSLYRLY